MTKTHLLIDGDVIAFVAAAAAQSYLVDSAGWHLPIANEREGEAIVDNLLHGLKAGLGADSADVYLSDPVENWRKLVDPTYKENRSGGERPLLLVHLKEYLKQTSGASWWPGLEADDTLGILATTPGGVRRTIVVGRDKDFLSIPGLHHTIGKDKNADGQLVVRGVTQWQADRFHLLQTLAGDRVDGYYGCPGIGMERAAQIIDCPMRLVPQKGVKTRGVNKGEEVTRWMSEPTTDYWACIVSHYEKHGLTEADALRTARLARILRHGEYDADTEGVTLWNPIRLAEVRRVS